MALPWLIPAGLSIAGTLLNTVGKVQQAGADADMLEQRAAGSQFDAEMARLFGEDSLRTSTAAQLAQRRGSRNLLAVQKAAIAQAGIGTGGSAADVVRESAANAELDALNIAFEGRSRFLNAMLRAGQEDRNTRYLREAASRTRRAGGVSGFASLLTGASSFLK
jgi:hypothetical protein